MAIYGYTRTSRSIERSGRTHESQISLIEKYAHIESMEIDTVFSDRAVSGFIELGKRPLGAKLLKRLKSADILIVPTFDRLFRSVIDARNTLGKLNKKGVRVFIAQPAVEITSKEHLPLVNTLIRAFAAVEGKELGDRIREAKQSLRKQGRYVGGKVDFGYRLTEDGNLVKDEESQEAIKLMKKLRKEGMSYRKISEEIKKQYKGRLKISHEGIRSILNRESAKTAKKKK